ncbi:pyruvate, water dikinase regulatory protein [Desemzia incerta]|uniref:pyruvate, water dikinase regulatory protein n=1 Tax=Desemzia incerta TaxID=82801 RepID=UPI0016601DAC|nr:pyruvate, water dikinase regulatory protein [Desemzia incerta]
MKKTICPIYIISDSVGGTAKTITSAVLAQFPNFDTAELKRFPFVTEIDQIEDILVDAEKERALIVTTLVNKDLIQYVEVFSKKASLQHVDLMSPLTRSMEEHFEAESIQKPGALHQLNADYFNRVAAMEFAVRYDDGKEPRGILKADLILLGVSRTSKTPLSLYLANLGYKVVNIPIIPEAQIPEELFKVPAEKIIGLTTNSSTLSKVRQARLASLGLQKDSLYADENRIKQELAAAADLFEQLEILTIDVENRSIEETAVLIEEYYRKTLHRSQLVT